MVEAALYILTGLTLYGGGHHLYLGFNRPTAVPHLRMGALYLLLAAFAFSSALTHQQPDLDTLLPEGKLAISLGIILWASLVWHIAFRTDFKPLLLLDAFTAAWAIFLVRNLTSPNSLLYADVTPVKQTLLSGETIGQLFTVLSPWWTAVELTMLASLLFCFYACYRAYRRGRKALALVNVTGLVLLGLVTLSDHFVSVQLIQGSYLAPFGFLLFLLPGSLYPWVRDWRRQHGPAPAPIYNLTYMPDQASFHTDVSQLHTPLRGKTAKPPVGKTPGPSGDQTRAGASVAAAAGSSVSRTGSLHEATRGEKITVTENVPDKAASLDRETLHTISDNLIDIAVYATMALNRFKRGDANPQTLASLCKKVRSQAIKTRRLASQLENPDQGGENPDTGKPGAKLSGSRGNSGKP